MMIIMIAYLYIFDGIVYISAYEGNQIYPYKRFLLSVVVNDIDFNL
jgi:hypothetical protein